MTGISTEQNMAGADGAPAADRNLDVTGLQCPLPLLKAKLALNELASGQVLHVEATDPGSERDFFAFVEQSHNEIMAFNKDADNFRYWIRKG